jgi:hypothetical protein
MEKQHGIIRDERGQDQPTDKRRAQQSDLSEKINLKVTKRSRAAKLKPKMKWPAPSWEVWGSPLLPDGGMTKRQEEQTPKSNDPGHVA